MTSKVIWWFSFLVLFNAYLPLLAASQTLIPHQPTDNTNTLLNNWRPSPESKPVATTTDLETGANCIHFPINFTENTSRHFWDIDLKADLSEQQAVTVRFKIEDVTPLNMLTVYFRAEDKWANTDILILKEGWQTVFLPLDKFESEGSFSWSSVDQFRFSPWKAIEGQTNIYLEKIELSNPAVILVEVPSSPQKSIQNLSKSLDYLGLKYATVKSESIRNSVPANVGLLIIPGAKHLPDTVFDSLNSFIDRQGKFIAFEGLPNQLAHHMGIYQGFQDQVEEITMLSSGELFECMPSPLNFDVQMKTWVEVDESSPTQVAARWKLEDNSPGDPACVVGLEGALITTEYSPRTPADGAAFLAVLINHYAPKQGKLIQSNLVEKLGIIGEYTTLQETTKAIRSECRNHGKEDQIKQYLTEAEQAAKEADLLKNTDDFCTVLIQSYIARDSLLEAYYLVQKSKKDEFRGAWFNTGKEYFDNDWPEIAKDLSTNGYNAIFPLMLWGGVAHYDSAYLPKSHIFEKHGDQIIQSVTACHEQGIEVHVWKANWNLEESPFDFYQKMKSEGRIQYSNDGKPSKWLCPSHPENFKLELNTLVEVVEKYDIDGIHFDYIRYPGETHCYCDGCRQRFQEQTDLTVKNWPEDCFRNGELAEQYMDWRANNITKLVEAVSLKVRELKPELKISAAVFRSYPNCRRVVAQDWALWGEKGYIDYLCPMDYTNSADLFTTWVTNQQETLNESVKLFPGIGATSSISNLTPDQAIRQIRLTRSLGTEGFLTFIYTPIISETHLPIYSKGIMEKN